MKKILTTAALMATLASNAFAEENVFYVRLDAGAAILPKVKDKGSDIKMKKRTVFVGGIGVGTYVMDNLRAELALGHHFDTKYKGSFADSREEVNVQHKLKVTDLMLKGLVDVGDFEVVKLFVGGGVGAAQVSDKVNYKVRFSNDFKNNHGLEDVSVSGKAKKKINFAYTLTAGVTAEAAEGVKVDFKYSFLDAGKTHPKNSEGYKVSKIRFRAHDFTAGVRFEL